MARLLKCCLNGSRRPGDHERLPLSSGQLAGAARAAVDAGAGAVHFHPRDADGFETLAPAWCDAAVSAVRSACPQTPLGVTTGAWIEPDIDRRVALIHAWRVLPDFASVNLAEEGWERVVGALQESGIGVEAGLATPADAERAAASGVGWTRALVEPRAADPEEAMAAARAIDAVLDAARAPWPRLHHGFGAATWGVIRQGLELGRDVRVGLEDVLTLPDGRRARDNAELVAAVLAMTLPG